jgi:UDP-N-acetylglucosamine 4,6-dehydratase
MVWSDYEILITGGTGFLSKALTKKLLKEYNPKGIRLLSRNEENQRKLEKELKEEGLSKKVSFLIGDVRDRFRIGLAMQNVDIVIHTAALKQVPTAERDPMECVLTNVVGTQNIIEAAIINKVKKALLISSDKAVKATNLYGATKKTSESLFINGNIYFID